MQRDRLEGWMVKQIEQADLAKETVIQLPTRATTAPTTAKRVSALQPKTPRRRFLGQPVTRPHTTPSDHPPQSPSERFRQRVAPPRTRLETAAAAVGELDSEDSVARQWRLHFQDPQQSYTEEGRVDRSKVLKGSSPRRTMSSPIGFDDGDEMTDELAQSIDDDDTESPLLLWGLPREYILEYIRQSVMPSAWTTHARFTGEWEAEPPSDADGRYAAKGATSEHGSVFITSLPPLSSRSKESKSIRSPRSSRTEGSTSPSRSYRRPHPGAAPLLTSPRYKPPRREERIHAVLNELRADPKAWEAFQKEVKRYLDDQRRKQHGSNKIRENKHRAAFSPRAPDVLAERKRRNDERAQRARRHRELLMRREEDENEAMLLTYQRKIQRLSNQKTDDADAEMMITTTVGYRRRRMWLMVFAFSSATTELQRRLVRAKQQLILEKMQTKAARVIQRLWKKWKWRHASHQTIVIYTWLRRCLWKIMFNLRVRRKHRCATLLQRFMLDQLSGSRETRNFNRMMLKWRGKVIHSQRISMDFVTCTRMRLQALSLWWDVLDHERQRGERQHHDKLLPTTDEKEAEWHAIVSNRRSLIRRPSSMGSSTRSLSITSSTASPTPAAAAAAPPPASPPPLERQMSVSGSSTSLSRRSISTRDLVDQIDERLTTMQQVLTPIEIQRLQQHAFHVVKIPKAIKMKLLNELLTAVRKEYIAQLTKYHEQVACASYAREVKLDDARAIVQSGASWGTLLLDSRTGQPKLRKPIFQLYSGEKQTRSMEELVRRGVQLTLESDPEQRAIVERQRHHRQTLETSVPGGTPGSTATGGRRSNTPTSFVPLPPSTASASGSSKPGGRKLTFAVPATIKEKPK